MTTPPTVRKGRKFDQVLDGARDVFLRDGFEGASVDDIAREAGVSKATLYNYFPDKRLLFIEVCSVQCILQADETLLTMDDSISPTQALEQAARRLVSLMLSGVGIKIFKLCVAEAERFPDLTRQFYETGPAVVRQTLRDYIERATLRGELRVEDYTLAADQFGEMCKAHIWLMLVLGLQTSFSETEVDRVILGAVDTFMARYGVGPDARANT